MFDEDVGQAQLEHRAQHAGGLQRLRHRAAGAAHDSAFFHRHQRFVAFCDLQQQGHVQRLGPAHVDHGGIQRFGRLQRRVQQRAERQDGDAFALAAHFALAEWQALQPRQRRHTGPAAARVAHGHGVVLLESGRQQLPALPLVRRARHAHVRNAAHEGDVVGACVRGAISPHQPGPVEREHHRQVLQRDVVDELVVRPLQEGGVNGDDRLDAFAGHAGREGHGMLLCNADVVVPRGKALLELDHARTFAHGGRDAHQAIVLLGHVAQPLAEHLREGLLGRRGGLHQSHAGVEFSRAVVGHGVGLGQLVALALLGHHMQELRPLQALDVLQRGNERVEIVPVDGADVVEAEFLEQRGRHHHALGLLLQPLGQLQQRGRVLEHALAHVARLGVELPAHQLGQVAVQRPHGRADAHVVVVQDDEQVGVGHAGVVQRLEGHARRHGAVADDGHRVAFLTALARGQRHAQRGRDAGAGMRGAEGVVLAFGPLGKARQAVLLAQRAHAVAAAGQDFVRIGLVADVPHQAVARCVEHGMQGHGQLHRAQVGTQMATGLGDAVDHVGAQLRGHGLEFRTRQAPQVGRVVHAREQGVGSRGHKLFF